MSEVVTRPPSVTFAVILTWAAAIGDLITGGALVWLSLNNDALDLPLSATELRSYAFALLGAGLLTAAFALGVAAGAQVSRIIVMLIMAARLAAGIFGLSMLEELTRWHALGQIAGSALIILALSTPRAFLYFRSS